MCHAQGGSRSVGGFGHHLVAGGSRLPGAADDYRKPLQYGQQQLLRAERRELVRELPGYELRVGRRNLAQPAFGGFQAGAGLSTNLGWSGPNGNFQLGLNFGQGFRQSLVNQTPVVTLMNGQIGSVNDTSQTPFVISVVPVIGGGLPGLNNGMNNFFGPPMANPMAMPPANARLREVLQNQANNEAAGQAAGAGGDPAHAAAPPAAGPQALNLGGAAPAPAPAAGDPAPAPAATGRLSAAQASSAGRPAPSVAEARRMHDEEKAAGNEELLALMERARAAEDDGKPGVAKIYYQMVAHRASGDLKQQALTRLDAIRGTTSP